MQAHSRDTCHTCMHASRPRTPFTQYVSAYAYVYAYVTDARPVGKLLETQGEVFLLGLDEILEWFLAKFEQAAHVSQKRCVMT